MRRRGALHTIRFVGFLASSLLVSLACSTNATGPAGAAPLVAASSAPYIEGRIVDRRQVEGGGLRLRVRTEVAIRARVDHAIVSVPPSATVRWSDGTRAGFGNLALGHRVAVWTTGEELRSLPPQVSATSIRIERPKALGLADLFGR